MVEAVEQVVEQVDEQEAAVQEIFLAEDLPAQELSLPAQELALPALELQEATAVLEAAAPQEEEAVEELASASDAAVFTAEAAPEPLPTGFYTSFEVRRVRGGGLGTSQQCACTQAHVAWRAPQVAPTLERVSFQRQLRLMHVRE